MKRPCLSAVIVLTVSITLSAQDAPTAFRRFDINWNVLSYSRENGKNLYGGDLGLAIHVTPRLAIVADVAIHEDLAAFFNTEIVAYRFGPRLTAVLDRRISMFGEVLAGGARLTGSTRSVFGNATTTTSAHVNGFALALGGGIDVGIRQWFAIRAVQLDYSYLNLSSVNSNSNGLRLGGGVVFRFGS